ncbi:MAG: hypothetical protein KAV41_01015 [Candidatus Pacebacteria bacterium]|nr:hypothetical protein [Candidatus Paceibacterota bacterium]
MLLKKNIIWIPIVISLIALIISGFSYVESRKSNTIANDAFAASQQNFELENRPYISARSVKFSETGNYLRIESQETELILEFQFELKNYGGQPAKEIRMPDGVSLSGRTDQFQDLKKIEYKKSLGTIALASGETFFIVLKVRMGELTEEEIADNFKKFNENILSFPLALPIYYKTNTEDETEHRTFVYSTISPNNTWIHEIKID